MERNKKFMFSLPPTLIVTPHTPINSFPPLKIYVHNGVQIMIMNPLLDKQSFLFTEFNKK